MCASLFAENVITESQGTSDKGFTMLFLNRVEAIGASARAPFGYAYWAGEWPIDPIVQPLQPLMIRDFNFTTLADNV